MDYTYVFVSSLLRWPCLTFFGLCCPPLSVNSRFWFQRIAGEIKSFSTDGGVAPKLSKRMDKFMLYMLIAGKKALADTGITVNVMEELDKTRCGVLIGSAMGGMKVFYAALEALRISYGKMNPFCVPFATTNMGSAILAMDLGFSFRQFLRAREFGSSGISSAAPMRHV